MCVWPVFDWSLATAPLYIVYSSNLYSTRLENRQRQNEYLRLTTPLYLVHDYATIMTAHTSPYKTPNGPVVLVSLVGNTRNVSGPRGGARVRVHLLSLLRGAHIILTNTFVLLSLSIFPSNSTRCHCVSNTASSC